MLFEKTSEERVAIVSVKKNRDAEAIKRQVNPRRFRQIEVTEREPEDEENRGPANLDAEDEHRSGEELYDERSKNDEERIVWEVRGEPEPLDDRDRQIAVQDICV